MDRPRTPRRRPEAPSTPTTLHEITRRYVATALALSKAMGLPCTETFIREHRESITTCFIEAGRAGVRLPPAVQLPPLVVDAPVVTTNGHGDPSAPDGQGPTTAERPAQLADNQPVSRALEANGQGDHLSEGQNVPPNVPPPALTDPAPPPMIIPVDAGLPCRGVAITALKPAQLAMLIARAANLVHEQGAQWVPLLGSLQVERARRLEWGKRRHGEEPQG